MRTSAVWALALITGASRAFKDTSPFFLFSTSELPISSLSPVSASTLRNSLTPHLEKCPSDTYVIVSQPGVTATDYFDLQSAPILRKMALGNDQAIRSNLIVEDVKGIVNAVDLSSLLRAKCGAQHLRVDASTGSFFITDEQKPRVINLDFPVLPSGNGRAAKLSEHDAFMASVLDILSSTKYTVLYTTSPNNDAAVHEQTESAPYEMDSTFQAPVHMELKRDLNHHERANDGNITLPDGPLFERYQFLSPGLFMGLFATIILLSILYIAISGVSSLQVTYAAFDKEMGPAVHKNKAQ